MNCLDFNEKYNIIKDDAFYNDLLELIDYYKLRTYEELIKQQTMHDLKCDCVKSTIILNKIKELKKQ